MVKATTSVVLVRAVLSLVLHARARRERDSGRLAAAAGAL